MRTAVFFLAVITCGVLTALITQGCDDKNKMGKPNLYLSETNVDYKYCQYKVFSDAQKETVIDTICIACAPRLYLNEIDTVNTGCISINAFNYVWHQEYSRERDELTGERMFLEKINDNHPCAECGAGKKRYIQVYFGQMDRY